MPGVLGAYPPSLTQVTHIETVLHSIVGLDQRPVRASGLGHNGAEESKSADLDGTSSPGESTSTDGLCEE